MDALKSLLGIHRSSNYYVRMVNALEGALDTLHADADVVIYNQSAEQTDERVNSKDRAVTNRYSNVDYHRNTLEQIKNLKEHEKDKEYIELDKEKYLADIVLSNPSAVIHNRQDSGMPVSSDMGRNPLQGTGVAGTRGLSRQKIINDFLKKFGITDFIDSMSKDELLSELEYIGREYADYDLIAPNDVYLANDKSSVPASELAVLRSNLMQRFGKKKEYGCVAFKADGYYICNYKGEGEFDIIRAYKIDNAVNDTINGEERNSEAIDRWSVRDEFTKRTRNSNSFDVEERRSNVDNAGLDYKTSQGESIKTESTTSSNEYRRRGQVKTGFDGTSSPRYTDAIETFTTPEGEIYGFVTKDGEMYLDETKIKPEHPLHEYTHIWDQVVAKNNPKLWHRGIEPIAESVPRKRQKTKDEYEQEQNQSDLQQRLSWSDSTIDEAKRVLKRGDGRANQEKQLEQLRRKSAHT